MKCFEAITQAGKLVKPISDTEWKTYNDILDFKGCSSGWYSYELSFVGEKKPRLSKTYRLNHAQIIVLSEIELDTELFVSTEE